jgi:hypothetical protein
MRLAVTGGRDYTDRATVFAVLDVLAPTELAHGDADGLDQLAKQWAESHGVPCTPYPVTSRERRALGNWAPHARNGRMLDDFRPDTLAAVPGHEGTANCTALAFERGIRVLRVDPVARRIRALPARDSEDERT